MNEHDSCVAKELSATIPKELKTLASESFKAKTSDKNYIFLNDEIVSIKTGETIEFYNRYELTESWLTMSNDNFFKTYGFNWIPPVYLRDKTRWLMNNNINYFCQLPFLNNLT